MSSESEILNKLEEVVSEHMITEENIRLEEDGSKGSGIEGEDGQ